MKKIPASYKLLKERYLLSLIFLYLTQTTFYLLNANLFQIDGFGSFFKIFLGCTRYALSSLSVFLAPYLLLCLLPIPGKSEKVYRYIKNTFFYAGNIFMMVVNLIDTGYYRFTFKRLTADITRYLGVGGDFKELIPQFLRDYWQIVVIFIVLLAVFILADKFLRRRNKTEHATFSKRTFFTQSIVFIIVVPLLVIAQRGGLQTRPLNLMHASRYASTQNTALVLNTPFTLYRTFGKPTLEKKQFFSQDDVNKIYNPHIKPQQSTWADSLFATPLQVGKTNIVVIILESFSAEYLKTYNTNGTSYTPFLDSLAKQSIVFQGLSNGKKSIDGIPAVLSSLPLMMEESYLTSCYGDNELGSIASAFASHGYATAFFHGGYNGTMNFDNYTRKVGFKYYYGKNEYNNDKDYDGNWGIYDEPFLQYHSALTSQEEFKTQLGLFRIPMIIYHPGIKTPLVSKQTMQQIDIYPTIADLLHLDDDIFCFGRSAFSPLPHYYIYYTNGEYLLLIGDYLSKYKEDFAIELYNVKQDPHLQKDISSKEPAIAEKHKRFTEAIIQQYNNSIISNKTHN